MVFGVMKDKAVAEMLEPLRAPVVEMICTTAPTPRAAEAGALAAVAKDAGLRAEAVQDPIEALTRACGRGRPVVVAGSIFLVGPVREWLARDILR